MSHEHFSKSTKEDVLKMLEMRRAGKSTNEIGEVLKKNHTSILYWIHKIAKNNGSVDNFFLKNAIINVVKKEKKEIVLGIDCCKVCRGKKKDKRFKMTDSSSCQEATGN